MSLVSKMCHYEFSFSQLPIIFPLLSDFCESHCIYYLCVQDVVQSKFVNGIRLVCFCKRDFHSSLR